MMLDNLQSRIIIKNYAYRGPAILVEFGWMYIEEQLKYDVVSNTVFGDNWFLAVEVKSGAISGLFGGVYHSPSTSDVQFIKDFEIWLNDVLIDEKTNVIVGDFNIRWDEAGCATELKNVTDAAGLVQKVREATRTGPRSSTMIDLVFTNSECCEANIVEEMKISDHETIGINIGGPVRISVPEKNKARVSWRRYSKDRLQHILRNDPTLIERGGSVDEDAERLSNALISAVNQLIDVCDTKQTRSHPWYGPNLRNMKSERDRAYRLFKESRSNEDWKRYKILRNCYVRELQMAKNESIVQEIRDCQGDSKRMWKCLKSLILPAGRPTTQIIMDGSLSEDETAIRLNNYFVASVREIHSSIVSTTSEQAERAEDTEMNTRFCRFEPITVAKLQETVHALKECAGVENVTKRVLLDSFDVIKLLLLEVVNRSLQNGVFPATWKKTLVIPIPKVPKSTRPEDYRPINMLPLYEKILETLAKEQIMNYVDNNGIILEEQSGFRKHHSCETALNLLLLKWKQSIERGKIVMAVFVDLKRAFETIDRSKLRDVLKRYGIQGIALKWFSSYLENRTQVTRYNKSVSSETAVDLGVPQGSVLGPLLFILYINDLKRVLHRVEVNLFADDTVLFFEGSSYTECFQVMNEELRYFSEWLKWKKLKLNIAKTKYMIVTTRSQTGCTGEVRIDEEVVERVKSMKYLGVMLDEKLNFCEHINYSIKKAAQKFGVLCRVSRYLPFDAKVTLYKTIIAPHFDYCASIQFLASKTQLKRMQILQNKVMRLILQCERLTPRVIMLNCLQWMSIRQRIEFNTLVFIFRVVNGMAPQYLTSTVCYGWDMHRYETRYAGSLRLPNYRKTCTQNSLLYKGYSLFNQLPEDAQRTNNLRHFKRLCSEFVKMRPIE